MNQNRPLSQHLRQATSNEHKCLDDLVALDFKQAPEHLERRYGLLLSATHLFVQAIEEPINQGLKTLAPQPWRHSSQRLPAIEADLHDLGLAIPAPRLPECRFLTLPQTLGGLYVLEGSALGGRVICKQLKQVPGLASKCAFRYHGVASDTLSNRWRTIVKCLDTWCPAAEFDEAAKAARQAFALFETAFHQCHQDGD